MSQTPPERRARVRSPITLFVDAVEISPSTEFYSEVVKTAYDLEFTEFDVRKLHTLLGERLDKGLLLTVRIRFIGRLVSQ